MILRYRDCYTSISRLVKFFGLQLLEGLECSWPCVWDQVLLPWGIRAQLSHAGHRILPRDDKMPWKVTNFVDAPWFCPTAGHWLRQNPINDEFEMINLVQVLAWRRQTTSHYRNQCWYSYFWRFLSQAHSWLYIRGRLLQYMLSLYNIWVTVTALKIGGLLFTKRTDVLPQDLMKPRNRAIGCYNDRIARKFDRHFGSAFAEVPLKFQSDWKSLNVNLVASRLHEILQWTSVRSMDRSPG